MRLVLLAFPAGAFAQQALVSNLGQADFASASPINSLFGEIDHAQQFTTGGNSAGYRLNSVEIEFNRLDAGIPFSVSIRTNASGAPGTAVGTLQTPSFTAFTSDTVLTFSASGSGIALAANTSYFLVLDVTGDAGENFALWRVTTSMSEDSGAASGWSIADKHRFRQNTADAAWTDNLIRSSLKIRINGSAVILPTVTIARVASPVTEGSAARFTVSRTGETTAALTVQLSVSENSAGGRDFVASGNEGGQTFTIPIGSASAVYSVSTVGDTTDEPNGAVTVTVTAGTGYSVGTPASATVTVNDNDLPVVTIARDASPVTEGTAARFTVMRAGVTTAALPVNLSVSDVSGSDFVASDNEGTDTVTIAAGQASVAYSVATVADKRNEANGDVTVALAAGTGYRVGTPGMAVVRVEDDDTPDVDIDQSDDSTSVAENGGTDTYTVRLETQPSHNVTITVSSATDSAATVNKAGGAAGKTQTLTFTPSGTGAWNVAQTITVTGVNNSRDDVGNQRSSVISHTATSGDATYNGISIDSVTVTVTDDDTPELTVAAQGGATRINESATATIIVTSDIPVDGSIDHGQPTVSARGSVSAAATTISGGGTTNSYTVTATDNNLDEPDGSITTGIGAGSGYTLGTPSSVTLTVRDDDPTIVSLAGGGALFEGEMAAFTVTLGRALVAGEIIDVPLAVSGANVTTGDWNLALDLKQGLNTGVSLGAQGTSTPQVTFTGAGARTATLLLTTAAGSGGKTLRVELGPDGAGANGFDRPGLATNVGGGADPHATARGFSLVVTANTVINDRDFILFSPSPNEASGQVLPEGAQRTLTVHRIAYKPDGNGLHQPNAWGFRLCFTGTATPGADFSIRHNGGYIQLDREGCTARNSAAHGTARAADASLARFYITIFHDDLDEAEESVIVTLSRTTNTGVSSEGFSETRFAIAEPPLIDKVRHYTSEIERGWSHVLRWRRALHALSGGNEGEGPAMTAAEARGFEDRNRTRWAPVAAALTALEGVPQRAQSAPPEDSDEAQDDTLLFACGATPASLVDTVRGYWQSNRRRAERGYGENWRRVLIAFGAETHATLAAYTAAEARESERKWSGWRPVREELERLEACGASISVAQNAPPPEDNDEAVAEVEAAEDGEAQDDATPPACAAPPASLVSTVRGYWQSNRGRAERGYGENWRRVLIAFGAETHATLAAYTAAEARDSERKWSGWRPVREELERLETCVANAPAEQTDPPPEDNDDPVAEVEAAEDGEAQDDATPPAPAEVTVSVDDASAPEGSAVEFAVRLSAPAPHSVIVFARTRESAPVSAEEGVDYRSRSPRSTFAVFLEGDVEKKIPVATINDAHDDSGETFELVLTQASDGAVIADAVGVGTITNDDPLPGAYLARFGRAAAEQALGGVAARMAAPREPGMQGRFAGHALAFGTAAAERTAGFADGARTEATGPGRLNAGQAAEQLLGWRRRPAHEALSVSGAGAGLISAASQPGASLSRAPAAAAQSLTLSDLLLDSRFAWTGGMDGRGGNLAFWGQGARTAFNGAEDGVALEGDATVALVGADYARSNWLMGVALMQSRSSGGYRSGAPATASSADAVRLLSGAVGNSLAAAIPYAAWRASERLDVWGALGRGAGHATVEPEGSEPLKAGIGWTMAAAGLKSELLAFGGGALSLVSDALWARTASERIKGLEAAGGGIARLRLGLEGKRVFDLRGGGSLTPRLEIGARRDGGDAETGFGVEVGGGISWSAPRLGLALGIEGRALITHEDGAMRERGFSASLGYDPSPDSALGLSLSLRQELGGASSGGLSALFANDPLARRSPGHGGGGADAGRWAMEAGYGLPVLGGRFVGTPHLGLSFSASGHGRDLSFGWRLAPEAGPGAPDLSLGVLATRRGSVREPVDHGIGIEFRGRW